MAYIVAQKHLSHGSVAHRMNYGKEMSNLVKKLGRITLKERIHIFSVSSTEAWGEYGPYNIFDSFEEFISAVFQLFDDPHDKAIFEIQNEIIEEFGNSTENTFAEEVCDMGGFTANVDALLHALDSMRNMKGNPAESCSDDVCFASEQKDVN